MPDIVIRGIDNDVAERIMEIARLNNMPINDVLLKLDTLGGRTRFEIDL